MQRMTIALAAALLLGPGLTACGGSDRERIAQVFADLEHAQAKGDAKTACERIYVVEEPFERTADPKPAGAESEKERERKGGPESDTACRRAFEQGLASRRAQIRSIDTKVEQVSVKGDRATARLRATVVRSDGSRFINASERHLVRRDERWRISITPER